MLVIISNNGKCISLSTVKIHWYEIILMKQMSLVFMTFKGDLGSNRCYMEYAQV